MDQMAKDKSATDAELWETVVNTETMEERIDASDANKSVAGKEDY